MIQNKFIDVIKKNDISKGFMSDLIEIVVGGNMGGDNMVRGNRGEEWSKGRKWLALGAAEN